MRPLARAAAVGAVVVAISVATAPTAFAHATYKSSNPPDEGRVSSPPSEITAEFTEPMTGGSYMDVTDPCGRDVGTGSEQTGSSMRVQNTGTAAGTYVVFWKAVSIDGHTTVGDFTFTSTGGEPCPDEEDPEDPSNGSSGDSGTGGGSGNSGDADQNVSTKGDGSGAESGDDGDSNKRHGKHSGTGDRGKERGGGEPSGDAVAQAARSDIPDEPSALEGIPMGGLWITLAVSALIGAAGGKIYVSLSGDEE